MNIESILTDSVLLIHFLERSNMIILSPDENEKTGSDKQVKPVSNPPPPPPPPPPPEKYEIEIRGK